MSRAQQQTVFRVKEKNILSGIVKCQESIPIPQPHEVLVRIHAVSLNFRDYLPFSSKYPLPVKQDVVPGSDMAGEVLSIGSAVLGFKQGDRVTANFDQNHWYGTLPDERGASLLKCLECFSLRLPCTLRSHPCRVDRWGLARVPHFS